MKQFLFLTIFILTGLYVYAQNAVIEHVTGTVEIKQPGEGAFKSAAGGDKLFKETVISTSFKSFAIIKIGGTTITARPLTHLTLTEIQDLAGSEILGVNLQTGRVRVEVKPPAGTKASTSISSPATTASVRGTSFEFDINNIYVSEGSVVFRGNWGQNILVRAGESSSLNQSGSVTTPKEERNANLMPPSLAGTGAGTGVASSPAAVGVAFTIGLEFHEGNRP